MWRILILTFAFAAGCARTPSVDSHEEPLSFASWKTLPPEQKYEVGTLERLKLGEPRLQDDREWQRFLYGVVAPGKKQELPAAN